MVGVKSTTDQPLFFIGMPRSGTSIIQEAFSRHEALGWLSNYSARFPSLPELTAIHRLFGGMQGQRSQGQALAFYNKILPRPSESYPVWKKIFGDKFLYSCLEGVAPSERERERARKYTAKVARVQGKKRFCAKLTGPPRISFLSGIFDRPCFVDIIRDPRAVIASLMVDRDRFWKQRTGAEGFFWDCNYSRASRSIWEESGRLSSVLAAIQWDHMQNLTRKEVDATGVPYLSIKYEDYVDAPGEVIDKITAFCELESSSRLRAWVEDIDYYSANNKYLDVLARNEIEWIERVVGMKMDEFGYPRSV